MVGQKSEFSFSKWVSTTITIILVLFGLAVSWGAKTAEIAALTGVVKKEQEKVRNLELQNAANTPILKNIEESIKRIEETVEELRKKK